jgi:hypothetical protein
LLFCEARPCQYAPGHVRFYPGEQWRRWTEEPIALVLEQREGELVWKGWCSRAIRTRAYPYSKTIIPPGLS